MQRIKDIAFNDKSRMINYIIMIEFILCFILSFITKKNIIILILTLNSVVILSVYIIKNDYILIFSTIIFSIISTYLYENIGVLKVSVYFLDFLILLIFIKLFILYLNRKIYFDKLYIPIIVLVVSTFISCLLNRIYIIEYLGYLYKDYLRYFIVFLGIINLNLKFINIKKIIKLLWIIFILNIPFVLIQNEISKIKWYPKNLGDIRQDYLSGIIGGKGTTELGLIIVTILTISFVLYLNKLICIRKFITMCVAFSIILAISEIKFAFLLIPIMLGFVLIRKINIKSIITIALVILMMLIGLKELGKMYPWFENFLDSQKIQEYIYTEYASSGISRGDSFVVATNNISDNPMNFFFGHGISSTNINTESYYKNEFQKKNKYNFRAFNISQYIIELGAIGIGCLSIIAIYIMNYSNYLSKYGKNEFSKIMGNIGFPFIMLLVISIFYNMSMTKVNFAILAWSLLGLIIRIKNENIGEM